MAKNFWENDDFSEWGNDEVVTQDDISPSKVKPKSFTERFVENTRNPFSQLAGNNPKAQAPARLLDIIMQPAANLFDASAKIGTSARTGDILGATEGATRAGTSLLSSPFLPAITGFNLLTGQLPEKAQSVIGAPFNPAKTLMGEGDVPATMDNVLQGVFAGTALKKGMTSPEQFKQGRMKIAEKNILRSAPPKGEVNFNIQEDFKKFTPYLKEEAQKGFDKSGQITRQTDVKVNKSLQKFYDTQLRPQIDRAINLDVETDLSGAIEQMKKTVSESDPIFDKAKAKAVDDLIQNVPKSMSIKDADALLKDLNTKTKAFEDASTTDQYQMLQKDPKLEAMIAFKRGLRDAVVESLRNVGEKNTEQLRQTYGSGARLRNLIHDNVLTAENEARKSPVRFGGRAGLFGVLEDMIARTLGFTKEGQMKKGVIRIGRYSDKPQNPFVPSTTKQDVLNYYQNKYGAEDIRSFNEPPTGGGINYETQAKNLNVKYVGMQDFRGYPSMPTFYDNITGSNFTITAKDGTLANAVARVRGMYAQPKMTWQEALAQQQKTKK